MGITLYGQIKIPSPKPTVLFRSSDSSSGIVALSKYSPQTSQIYFLEEASTGLCVEAIP